MWNPSEEHKTINKHSLLHTVQICNSIDQSIGFNIIKTLAIFYRTEPYSCKTAINHTSMYKIIFHISKFDEVRKYYNITDYLELMHDYYKF